ncbi:hypothetical protein ACFL1G_06990 [Planctomycetota bacterium]
MELSWLMKIRIGLSAAVGVVLIGIIGWPIAEPAEPFGVVSITAGSITIDGILTLAGLAMVCGFTAYFLCWPYGREIGILAVPAGLAVWSVRTGSVANLIQANPSVSQRQTIYAGFQWEPFFWLGIVALGFTGVFIGQLISRPGLKEAQTDKKCESKLNVYVRIGLSLVISILTAQIFIRIFARDVSMLSRELGSVLAQPAVGQIIFALLLSFGIAGFVVKKFLDVDYGWPVLATGFVALLAARYSLSAGAMERMVQYWPANFFNDAVLAVLPVQLVTFGTAGAIAGYWMAVRYDYWHEHEIE